VLGWSMKVNIYDWLVLVGILINETEFTVVASEIMLYTIPLEKEYNWSDLNISEVRVSVDCFTLSCPVAIISFTVAKVETEMFVASIFPDVIFPVAVIFFIVAKPDTFIFEASNKVDTFIYFTSTVPSNVVIEALDTTIPEFFKYLASVWAIVEPPPPEFIIM
jgi:hypothetical protein